MLTPYGRVKRERDHKAEHDTTMRQVRARVPCAPRACPCCARSSGHRSVCPRCARLRARAVHGVLVQFVVDMCQHVTVGRHHPVCPHLVRPRLPPSCASLRYVLALCILALCSLALPVLTLRVPIVRALVVRARAVRLRAGRVVCLCSVRLDRADFARQRRRHPASPRIVPVDAAACRAYRNPGTRNHS